MRIIGAVCLVAISGMLAGAPARADWVPPFKGNDTGGIIAFSVATKSMSASSRSSTAPPMARSRNSSAVAPHDGGYISFACRWVPYGADERPLRVNY